MRVFGLYGIVYRLSDHLSALNILMYGCMDRHYHYRPPYELFFTGVIYEFIDVDNHLLLLLFQRILFLVCDALLFLLLFSHEFFPFVLEVYSNILGYTIQFGFISRSRASLKYSEWGVILSKYGTHNDPIMKVRPNSASTAISFDKPIVVFGVPRFL